MSIFKNNINSVITDPIKMFIMTILPIIFIFLFLYGEGSNVPVRVIVKDYDDTEFTRMVIDEIDSSARILDVDEEKILDTMISCNADYAIIIEKGYTKTLFAGKEPKIKEQFFVGEEKVFSLRHNINTYINSARQLYDVANSENEFYEMLKRINSYKVVSEYSVQEENSSMKTVQAIGFFVQFILYSTIIIVSSIIVDKENNITPRILSSPMSIFKYLSNHYLSFAVLEALNVLILMVTLRFGFGYSFYGHFILVTSMLFIFAISIAALNIMVLSICRKSKSFYWVMICISTPLIMLGGAYFEISSLPDIVQKIAIFNPVTWVMNFTRDVLENNNLDTIMTTIIVFAAFTMLFLSISRAGIKQLLRQR